MPPNNVNFSQTDRLIQITTTLPDTEQLLIESFSGTESVSSPFEFRLVMLSTNGSIDLKSLLRTSVTVNLTLRDGTQRPFNGIFTSIRQGGVTNDDLIIYDAVMSSKFALLSLIEDCKIFQSMSVPDIVSQVLRANGVTDIDMPSSWPSQRTYAPRDYCVQYRETSLNFISRLLEEEGIFYYFTHTAQSHTMVFRDASPSLVVCPGKATIEYNAADDPQDPNEPMTQVTRLEQVQTGQVTLTDYNFETPSTDLKHNLAGASSEESYDYPGNYMKLADGETYVKLRLDEAESEAVLLEGVSYARELAPGFVVTLTGHFDDANNVDLVLLSVTHTATDTTYRISGEGAALYGNTILAIPKTVTYRPPRRALKPVVRGTQTALVVGKAGEEIWVDSYGRVKVQFYWDRVGTKDENSSCWVRVAQIWAGKNWGWVTIPRIGQEVIVDFLEGDPDRPIIIGRVYNADQMPPYALPDNQTQSGIKTRSSKQGTTDNFNEICFEDNKGSEKISVHAEKDMDTTVENDDTQTIQNNRTITVSGTHTETITKDTTIEITQGNYSMTIDQGNETREIKMGNQSITLDQGNQTTELKMGNQSTTLDMGNQSVEMKLGNQSTKCDLGAISFEAMQSITLKVMGSQIQITPASINIQAPMIQIAADGICQVNADGLLILKGGLTMIN